MIAVPLEHPTDSNGARMEQATTTSSAPPRAAVSAEATVAAMEVTGTTNETTLDEASAVARAQDGDLEAFEALVDRYQAPIFRLAMRVLRDRSQAEDVVQDTFVAAWRKLPTLIEPAAFKGWLYQVATRRSLDLLRRRRPQQPLDEDQAADAVLAAVHDPADNAVRNAELDDFRRVLAELPEDLRTCWMLKELDGLSYDEIGGAVGIHPSTVRGRIARARRQLAERMQPWR